MNVPESLKYSEEHEWVRIEGNTVVIGITEFAQNELGDIVFVELPAEGEALEQSEPFGSVESVKTVSELYAPVSGKVIAVNSELESSPEKINQSPFEDGWLVKVELTDSAQLNTLWDAKKYKETYSD